MGLKIMKAKEYGFYVKYIIRNIICMMIAAVLFLLIIVAVSFFSNLNFTGFRLLYLLSRWNYYFSAIFAVISYYIFSAAVTSGCAETIDAICKKRFSWQKGIGSFSIFILFGYHLIVIAGLIYCSLRNDGTDYFLSVLPRTYAMNILIPYFILIGLSYVASCFLEKNKIFANSFFVSILIMTSPFLEKLIWRKKPEGFPIDKIVEKIKGFFGIFYQNAGWSPDTQYGLQTEDVRLFLQLFWIFLILGYLLWTHDRRKTRSKAVCFSCIVVAVVMGILSFGSASIYRQNESWNGIFADFFYYEEDGISAPKNKKTDYYISKYDLNVELKNQLSVSGRLCLVSSAASDEFVLTLYHGYHIKAIRAENFDISYQRNKDSITLKLPQKVNTCNLEIEYEGYSGKYYSNSQAVMLPGYFPWYPMAGEKQVFVQYPYYNGGNGYNPYNRIPEAEFILEVHTKCNFVTNLEAKDEHVFTGKADSISIIGGNISKTDDDSFINYLPLELNGINEHKYLEKIKKNWNQTLTEIRSIFGIDIDDLKKKKMIMVSKDMGRNFWNNYFVEFDDYILFSSDYLDSPTYINYLLQKTGKESQIGDLFASAIISSEEISAEKIIEKMITKESENQHFLSQMEGYVREERVSNRLELLRAQRGADRLLQEIVRYLLNTDIKTDDEFFDLS